jgi:TPR repeat protein
VVQALSLLAEFLKAVDGRSVELPHGPQTEDRPKHDPQDPDAAYRLAGAVMAGDYRHPSDVNEAFRLFQYSAAQGHVEAKFQLASLYWFGAGTPKDVNRACQLYLDLAKTGHAEGTDAAGVCHERGYGVPLDQQRAIELYKEAASKGSWKSALKLSKIFCLGLLGVAKDESVGSQWDARAGALMPEDSLIEGATRSGACPPRVDVQW